VSDPLLSMGFSDIGRAAGELDAMDVVEAMKGWGAEWGPKMTQAIQAVVPGESGGPLYESITFAGVEASSGGVTLSWTTDKEYATYLIEGTEAHGPAQASVLHWMSGGANVFAKWVSGVAPNTFPLSTAVEGLMPAMAASLADVFAEMFEES
jgi:hypothetical protein